MFSNKEKSPDNISVSSDSSDIENLFNLDRFTKKNKVASNDNNK